MRITTKRVIGFVAVLIIAAGIGYWWNAKKATEEFVDIGNADQTLLQRKPQTKEELKVLASFVHSSKEDAKIQAAFLSIAGVRDQALSPDLAKLCRSQDIKVRIAAVRAIGDMRDGTQVGLLKDLFGEADRNSFLRQFLGPRQDDWDRNAWQEVMLYRAEVLTSLAKIGNQESWDYLMGQYGKRSDTDSIDNRVVARIVLEQGKGTGLKILMGAKGQRAARGL